MSDTNCLACSVGFYLSGNTCVTACPNGFFGNISTKTCDPCNATCSICITSTTDCNSCKNGYYLLGNTCLTTCPNGFFGNTTTNTC